MFHVPFNLRESRVSFKFGDGTFQSLGKISIKIPTQSSNPLLIDVDVVEADVPLLIGIDILDKEKLVARNVHNVLWSFKEGWALPLTRKSGQLYIEWDDKSRIYFNKEELRKLHRHFYHPDTEKLFNLIKEFPARMLHPKREKC